MKTAIYIRFSTEKQDFDMQKHEIDAYLQYRPASDLQFYIDEAMTGSNTKRPQFKAMLNDCKAGKVEKIIVYKLDRLSRSLADLIEAFKLFSEHNVTVHSVQENMDFSTDLGKLFMHLLGSFAEFERSTIIARIKSGLASAKAKGTQLGRPTKIGNEMKALIRQKFESGISSAHLAAEFKISTRSVYTIVKGEKHETL